MNQSCRQCQAKYEVTSEDLAFLDDLSPVIGGKKQSLPVPTLCPECRMQRRIAHVNQLNLYERKCDLTGASVISNIRPGSPFKVYRQEDWHSDKWDALRYGRPFDFARSFFDQWRELLLVVPRPNLFTGYEFDENCDYTNHAGKNKDSYLIFDSDQNRDCYFSYSINQCVNCADCFRVRKSELCYECVDCVRCYGSAYLQDCDNCSDGFYLKNCTGCSHCLMCSNLRNKEYCVENKPVSKEAFEKFRASLQAHSVEQSARQRFGKLKLEYPQKCTHGIQNENSTGDYLVHCKNAYRCFDSEDLWDCRYVSQGFMPLKNCMDVHECGEGERLYECSVSGYEIYDCCFCNHTLATMTNLQYCSLCPHTKDSFGCIGVQRKRYCVFNKQYTKEEYETLVPRIIDHMRNTKEFGEFFPVTTSAYAYNETLAQDYYPLTRQAVQARGWSWLDEADKKDQYLGPAADLPDRLADAGDDVCKKILTCESTGKQYKIIPQELSLLRTLQIPLPRKTFFQRHKERMALRNPRKLWKRTCAKCQKGIETTYAPDRPEIVYCESCYLQAVY